MAANERDDGRAQVVGAALVRRDALGWLLLAARRTEPPALAGRWELPGGKVEPGESPEAALSRELAEELGLDVGDVGDPVPGPLGGDWPLGDAYALRVFLVTLTAGDEPVAREQHDDLRWLRPHEWDAVEWLPDDVPPVRAVTSLLAAR